MNEWSLFPNPTSGVVNVRYSGASASATIDVVDMGGRLVMSQRSAMATGQVLTLQGSEGLAPGAYTVRLRDANGVTNRRLTVQ